MKTKITLILLCALLLAGCGKASQKTDLPHFAAIREDTQIALNAPAAPVLELLGAPFAYAENRAGSGTGVEKTYRFSGLSLKTYPSEDGDRILGVSITKSGPKTSEGISVGDTADQVRACYGADSIQNNRCIIRRSTESLILLLQNDVVTTIQYSMV